MRDCDDSRVVCCCGSGLKPVEKFLDNGRSIGYFCEECWEFRRRTFEQDEPDDKKSV